MECSAFFPDTVQLVVDEALNAANTYYGPSPQDSFFQLRSSRSEDSQAAVAAASSACCRAVLQPSLGGGGSAAKGKCECERGATGKRSRAGQLRRCRERWICNLAAEQQAASQRSRRFHRWLPHETLTVRDDPVPVTEEPKRSLAALADSPALALGAPVLLEAGRSRFVRVCRRWATREPGNMPTSGWGLDGPRPPDMCA